MAVSGVSYGEKTVAAEKKKRATSCSSKEGKKGGKKDRKKGRKARKKRRLLRWGRKERKEEILAFSSFGFIFSNSCLSFGLI